MCAQHDYGVALAFINFDIGGGECKDWPGLRDALMTFVDDHDTFAMYIGRSRARMMDIASVCQVHLQFMCLLHVPSRRHGRIVRFSASLGESSEAWVRVSHEITMLRRRSTDNGCV